MMGRERNSSVRTTAKIHPISVGQPLDEPTFTRLRRRAVLDGCKWDPQVGDVAVLAPFPLFMRPAEWRRLAQWAEQLSAEARAAEREILARPALLDRLGMPRPIRRVLRMASRIPPTPAAGRVERFDFHYTEDGWRISEVNSDVPGGFSEASTFTQLMAEHFPAVIAGDPIREWSCMIANAAGSRGRVALLSAHRYMEDQQIMAYLGRKLSAQGLRAFLAHPRQIAWRERRALLVSAFYNGPMDAMVRFYPGQWLARWPGLRGGKHFFVGGLTPVVNPGIAVISESKRFPLVWDQLKTPMETWRRLLPETRDPGDEHWERDESWLLKTAFCDTGETVNVREALDAKAWKALTRSVRRQPEKWVAQRRFRDILLETPLGPMQACIGVYTFDGKAAGAYARVTNRRHIDYAAMDIALLLNEREGPDRAN
jgi:glutathionylspermidine synthase